MRNRSEKLEKIILCFDNSETSVNASEAVLALAKAFGSAVVGLHGYNAFMHQGAFRIMEPTLPVQYQREDLLHKQREMHNTLINIGMERISLSYLKPIEDTFNKADLNFRSVVRQGKNFQVLSEIIAAENGDLVVMGSSGFNQNGSGFLGSVCLRVLRNMDQNFLVAKGSLNLNHPRFVVALDGSSSAISALQMAKFYALRFSAELHLVYVFDSKLHKEIFEKLKGSTINGESPGMPASPGHPGTGHFFFNSKQQEKIHDEFIDKGLVRVGQMILEKAEKDTASLNFLPFEQARHIGRNSATTIVKKEVLEGQIYKRICDYAREVEGDAIFLGRTGRHYSDGIDIGSVTENVVRFAPCNVFIAKHETFKGWEL